MIRFVRTSGKVKPIGATSKIHKSNLQDMKIGDKAEVTDGNGNTLNIAKITEITNDDGIEQVSIVMIA